MSPALPFATVSLYPDNCLDIVRYSSFTWDLAVDWVEFVQSEIEIEIHIPPEEKQWLSMVDYYDIDHILVEEEVCISPYL